MRALRQSEGSLGASVRERLVAFVRVLRDNGLVIGLAETHDALLIMSEPGAARPHRLRVALRALFCNRRSDLQKFDDAFDAFWFTRNTRSVVKLAGVPTKAQAGQFAPRTGTSDQPGAGAPDPVQRGEGDDTSQGGRGTREGASHVENLAQIDFRHIVAPGDIAAAHGIAARLAKSMRARLTRRMRARRRGQILDLRRTIRSSVAHGGVPFQLAYRQRRHKPLRLVVLLDASGSMSLYSAIFLRFMHGVLDCFREAEAFVFHTKLVHVSPALRERDPQRAVERLTLIAQGTGGGTRIGESLATFNRWHAKRVIHSRTCVMIVSDGYDTGSTSQLADEMAALRRRCRRIAWLNPMIGWQDYAPEAAGMKAALPYVDLFAPAHNLASLQALEPYLARI
ncbi:VWA domain-containing protein [Beijerinckia sp. L45]|uniref:vWA domain-containing protein n=1 Tax=Beijerinckia sp. L45 TaxID=1641855 RepID=UPI00131DC8D8|nr:VWA domain-containing protein [Beijerinckia sp. L45]